MRRVSTSLMALAGIAALAAVPAATAGAQVSPTTSNQASALILAPSSTCNPAIVDAGPYTTSRVAGCSVTNVPLPTLGLSYSASALANVFAGDTIGTHVSFVGDGSDIRDSVNASGVYYRYMTVGSGVGSVVFTSAVNASHSAVSTAAPAASAIDAHIDWGFVNPDLSFGDAQDTFSYSSGPGGGDLALSNTSFTGTIDAADLGGASSIYYDVRAEAWLTVDAPDPSAFADIVVFEPDITCFSGAGGTGDKVSCAGTAVTGTPEPASIALMGTGLVGIAGFARRKRRTTSVA